MQFLIDHISCIRAGFWSAMASNLTNQSRNVLSKKVMVKKDVSTTDCIFLITCVASVCSCKIWNLCSISNGWENIVSS